MRDRVLDQAGDDELQPAAVGQHLEPLGDVDLDTGRVLQGGQGGVDGPGDVGRPQGQAQRVGLEPGHLVEVVGHPADALGLAADRGARPPDPFDRQLVGVGLEGDAEAEDRGDRGAQVLRDHGQELVAGPLRLPDGGHVLHDALVADDLAVGGAGEGHDVELAPDAVGPQRLEGDLGCAALFRSGGVEPGQRFRAPVVDDLEHVLQAGALEFEG